MSSSLPTVVTFPWEAPKDNNIKPILAAVQLSYGVPTITLMAYLLVFLGVNGKYTNSFYRLVQMDLMANMLCWLNTWLCLRSLSLQVGNRYLKFLESFFPGIWNTSTFLANFFFHMQFCSAASMSVHRISTILYYTQYNRFWSRWYLLIGILFISYSCLTQITGPVVSLAVVNGTIYLTNDFVKSGINQKRLLGFGTVYFLILMVLGITVARMALKVFQGTSADQGVSKKLTKIALAYAIVYSGIPIWTILNSIPSLADFLSTSGFTMLSIASDMITLSLPYILIIFDSNINRHILHLKKTSGFGSAPNDTRSITAI